MVVVAGLGTYLLRVSLIALLGRVSIPPLGERALRLVAPTVLATIAAQGVLTLDGGVRPPDIRHVAAAVAFAVILEYKGSGGKNAAPVAKEALHICQEYGYLRK